jgi:hypothetical protein
VLPVTELILAVPAPSGEAPSGGLVVLTTTLLIMPASGLIVASSRWVLRTRLRQNGTNAMPSAEFYRRKTDKGVIAAKAATLNKERARLMHSPKTN